MSRSLSEAKCYAEGQFDGRLQRGLQLRDWSDVWNISTADPSVSGQQLWGQTPVSFAVGSSARRLADLLIHSGTTPSELRSLFWFFRAELTFPCASTSKGGVAAGFTSFGSSLSPLVSLLACAVGGGLWVLVV